jgi:hypothetical protein
MIERWELFPSWTIKKADALPPRPFFSAQSRKPSSRRVSFFRFMNWNRRNTYCVSTSQNEPDLMEVRMTANSVKLNELVDADELDLLTDLLLLWCKKEQSQSRRPVT